MMAKKKQGKAVRTVRTMDDVARHFRVSRRTVCGWKAKGCPGFMRGGYDLAVIDAWRTAQRGDFAADDPSQRGYWETRKAKLEAQRRQLQLKIMRGRLIDLDIIVPVMRAHIAEAKTHLEQLPDYVLSIVDPQPGRKADIRRQLAAKVNDICQSLAESIRELTSDPEPDQPADSSGR